jgi:hypothetical protein
MCFNCVSSMNSSDVYFQWLICYSHKHKVIPVLPSLRCSWTNAARDGWELPQRCSWYMRHNFHSDAANYRDHTFLRKFVRLSSDNPSFSVSHLEISSLSMPFSSSNDNGSRWSIIIVNPTFWRETKWSRFVRDWLAFSHSLIFAFEDVVVSHESGCAILKENPRSGGCC